MGQSSPPLAGPVLLDNTVLTNFALVGQAELVIRLWPEAVCTTPHARDEYGVAVSGGLAPAEAWSDLPVVTLTEEEESFAAGLSAKLGAGERSCLAVAMVRGGLLASDDLDARRAAQDLGIPRTGTVGILVLCVRRGYLSGDGANAVLREMRSLGYRSPVESLDPLIEVP
jgi:predicted nucleic acid-binding protein